MRTEAWAGIHAASRRPTGKKGSPLALGRFHDGRGARSAPTSAGSAESRVGRAPVSRRVARRPLRRPTALASDHRGVAEALRAAAGADGVCLRLVSEEAGAGFPSASARRRTTSASPRRWEDDPRIKALIQAVRSPSYRQSLGDLPGYDSTAAGACNTSANRQRMSLPVFSHRPLARNFGPKVRQCALAESRLSGNDSGVQAP